MKSFLTAILLILSFCVQAQIEKVIPKRPSPPRLVNDYTNTLTSAQVQALEDKLVAYDDSTSNQIVIAIVNSLEGYDIDDYAFTLGRQWGVGNRGNDNGIVIMVAKDDHKLRIEVGKGLEGVVPDVTAKSIIDNSITPNFKDGNYYRGLDQGTDDIIKAAAGEYKAPSGYGKKKKGLPISTIIFIVIILIAIFGAGGGSSAAGTAGGIGRWIGSSAGGWSGGGGSSSGGGGFGGFGGGSFGGGGASGSW